MLKKSITSCLNQIKQQILNKKKKKTHFKPSCPCIVWYIWFNDRIRSIRYAPMYQTIHEHLQYALTIQNFLYTIWYISRIIQYWQLCLCPQTNKTCEHLNLKHYQRHKISYLTNPASSATASISLTKNCVISSMDLKPITTHRIALMTHNRYRA